MSKIDPKPARPPEFNPNNERYWDARDLEGELRRLFEICHNCRMCVNYCGSFPDIFARVDRDIERGAEGAERMDAADFASVTDHCWQCKICYLKCPYTPDEGHEWLVDIPRALTREKAQRARRTGTTLQDKALGEPGVLGNLSSGIFAPLTNFVNANRLVRKTIEKTVGISSEFPLPTFASEPFERWLKHHEPSKGAGTVGTVSLFSTCLGDYNFPNVPANAVLALEKNGYKVVRPNQQCCGMPNLDGGDIEAAKAKARYNVAQLHAALKDGHVLIGMQPTCTLTIKSEYPELLGTPEAREVADNVYDVMEFFDELRKEKKLYREFVKPLGKVAYHAPCHLRAQKIGFPAMRVLNLVTDTEVELVEQCSAVDGTWGMKAEYYEEGRKYAQRLVRGIEAAEADLVVSDCQLAARRIMKENGVSVIHPVEALARAYGVAISPSE
jgi:glycerol-3-phosphate dehydrogenase subunit C